MKFTLNNPTRWRTVNSIATFLFLITLLVLPHSSWQQQSKFQSCSSKEKCDECIRSFGCVWCADPNFQERRCQREGDSKCPAQFIQNPGIEAEIVQNRPLTVVGQKTTWDSTTLTENSQEHVVQISPQHIFLKLRPNEGHAHRIHVKYRQAQDYPVDLYYLMDLSNSMKDDKDKLSLLGDLLADTMTRMTSNFRLGFGSFVDKVAMPFVSIVPKNLREPCPGCAAPYGFRNVMKLSNDTSSFAGQVKLANVSGNLDAPEGGFDAIMQAVVCQEDIGWRDKARKLLVFSTDSSFHYAGDGKLAGIIKPNDGCCHLDECGMYSYSTVQDYPSVSQINHKIKEYSINLIFAVTAEQTNLYEQLSHHIEGSSCGKLSGDSSNVVELVKEQYEKITSSIELREKNLSPHLRVRYFTRCLNANGPLMQTNKCDGLRVGQTVEFEIEVELLSCPKNPDEWSSHFSIYPVGVREELLVRVEMLCDCGCSKIENVELHSARCSYHGTLKCGICECDAGFSGDDCNCTGEADKTDRCRPDNTSLICSDRGTCRCNKCFCSRNSDTEVFWGDYCECNNFSCPRVGGVLCAGHGECVCGKCVCLEGWIGNDCACDNSTTTCVGFDGQICSGHGTCQCNKCVCGDSGGYFGKYCEKCPTCPDKCADLKPCVECKVYNSGTLSKEECEKQCDMEFVIVDHVEAKDESDVFCTYLDERDCRATFTYTYTYRMTYQKSVYLTVQKNKECPPQALIVGVVFQLISTIVLIGLAFLVTWKIITSMKDRREFARFEKERMMAKWDAGQNPIYKQATSTFKNPTYCGS